MGRGPSGRSGSWTPWTGGSDRGELMRCSHLEGQHLRFTSDGSSAPPAKLPGSPSSAASVWAATGISCSGAVLTPLPDMWDEAIFHLCHIRVISGQFCSQCAFLQHRSKGYSDDERQPQE
jgi:hypothetical protein